MKSFEPPPDLQRLHIFADNDANGAGQIAAYQLVNRLAGKLETIKVNIPTEPGSDWNDVLNERVCQ